jgi:hypothetical protein
VPAFSSARLSSGVNVFGIGGFMRRTIACLAAALLVAAPLHSAAAQTEGTKTRLTVQKLKEMKANWNANKPKLKACRQDVRAKGLTGDDRWFYIEDCMSKS